MKTKIRAFMLAGVLAGVCAAIPALAQESTSSPYPPSIPDDPPNIPANPATTTEPVFTVAEEPAATTIFGTTSGATVVAGSQEVADNIIRATELTNAPARIFSTVTATLAQVNRLVVAPRVPAGVPASPRSPQPPATIPQVPLAPGGGAAPAGGGSTSSDWNYWNAQYAGIGSGWTWVHDASYSMSRGAFTDSDLAGSGHDLSQNFTISSTVNSKYSIGVGYTSYDYRIGGPADLKTHSDASTLFFNYLVDPHYSVGFFLDNSQIDIEDSYLGTPPINLGDQFGRWATGVAATYSDRIATIDWTLTGALSSMNKDSLTHMFYRRDSYASLMLDGRRPVWGNLDLGAHITGMTMVHNESTSDGTFGIVGADLIYHFSQRLSTSVGYEKTIANSSLDDNRLNLGLIYSF